MKRSVGRGIFFGVIALMLALLPAGEISAAGTGIETGKCGANVDYSMNLDTGELVISGTGAMTDYAYATDSPFYNYSDYIKSVDIRPGVTTVGEAVFAFCYLIEDVKIPDTVTSIKKNSFVGCVSLDAITIPYTVTEIADYSVGYKCSNGREGSYEKYTMTIIGASNSTASAYAEKQGISFAATDNLTGTCGASATWSIDLSTGTLTISGTGEMASNANYSFKDMQLSYYPYRSLVKKIKVEGTITTIGTYAFNGFTNLAQVELKEGVKVCSARAFNGCVSLAEITLPDSLETIQTDCFANCNALEKITLGASTTTVAPGLCAGCPKLRSIVVPEGNTSFILENGILYNKTKTVLIVITAGYQSKVYECPESVMLIRSDAFRYACNTDTIIFKSRAPQFDSYVDLNGCTIYYDGTKTGWDNLKSKLSSYFIKWIDMSGMSGTSSLSINATTTTVSVGKSIQLEPVLNPLLAADFVWESSDENVAVVSNRGDVIGVAPGSATITVKSRDNKYRANKTIQVTGEAFSRPVYGVNQLDENVLKYDSISKVTKQFVCEPLHGIYFLQGERLDFYSLIDGSFKTVYSASGCKSAFTSGNRLYMLTSAGCIVYDMLTQSEVLRFTPVGINTRAVGADSNGRIYVSGSDMNNGSRSVICLYDSKGQELSRTVVGNYIYEFSGFDGETGHFYYEGYYNYYSWGYDHPGKGLFMATVADNKIFNIDTGYGYLESGIISRSFSCLLYLCQDAYMNHQTSAELLDGRYLAAASASFGQVRVYDSRVRDEGGIKAILAVERSASETDKAPYSDLTSIGVRTVYNKNNNSIVMYNNNCTIAEYSLDTGEMLASGKVQHPVFSLLKLGDSIIAIEKENNIYYMEIVNWGKPSDVNLVAERAVMRVGELQTIRADVNMGYEMVSKWTSSNNKVVSVSDSGRVSAWSEGTADITCTLPGGMSKTVTITVTGSVTATPGSNVMEHKMSTTNNRSGNNYNTYAKVVRSYMMENADGTFTRVEHVGSRGVLIENYTRTLALTNNKTIACELPLFGGFYSGADANYIVFGQKNDSESDSAEVLRVVKYDKNWNRIGQASVNGANTYIPFDAGSLRMTETNGKLYIYTCHEMYKDSDGVHHQANMTYVVNEGSMAVEQSYYNVMNIAQAGYVSHSFNQFIQTDGTYVFRVDHGDAHPRGVSITRCDVGGKITRVRYSVPLPIAGSTGANNTGVSVGGLELSDDTCLIVGNSVEQNEDTYSASGQRNIFLAVTDKDVNRKRLEWLTDYKKGSTITPRTPHLVKLNSQQFLVMWEEYNSKTETSSVKMVSVDAEGNQTSDIKETSLALSDCKPIVGSDGLVRWYVTNKDKLVFFVINPYNLTAVNDKAVFTFKDPGYTDDFDNPYEEEEEKEETELEYSSKDKTLKDSYGNSYVILKKKEIQFKKANSKATSVTIPDTVKYKGTDYKVVSVASKAFNNCKKLKSVDIGKNVKTIGASAFANCKKLTKVTIPSKVTSIGKKAFYGCKSLKSITVKTSKLKKIGDSAIKGIHKKAVIKVPAKKKKAYKKLFKAKTGFKKPMKIK